MSEEAQSFAVLARDGRARTGKFTCRGGERGLETPAVLLCTRRGGSQYLTPDVLQQLGPGSGNVILDATQFLGNPAPQTVARAPGGGRGYCALDGKLLVVTGRDSVRYNYRHWRQSTNAGVKVEAFAGAQALGPDLYHHVASLFKPDLLVPLCDEVPAQADDIRLLSSVRRSIRWLDKALAAKASGELGQAAILAPIQAYAGPRFLVMKANRTIPAFEHKTFGGTSVSLRRRSAAECVRREAVFGFAICGMATGETSAEQSSCLEAALAVIPADSFRLLQGSIGPQAILDAVSAGIDCFDAAFASQATAAGYALDLDIEPSEATRKPGRDDLLASLHDLRFAEDAKPLLPGCLCFSCQRHSRAYIHHLLRVREMTAEILLEMHNLHQQLRFFGEIRLAIAEGRLSEFRRRFADRRFPLLDVVKA